MLILVTAVLAGCTEKLENATACPALCPGQGVPVSHVDIYAVTFDTTIGRFPPSGQETYIPLARRGDTLDVRGIVRFDSLPKRTLTKAGDTTTAPITTIDSAWVKLRFAAPKSRPAAWTVEVYDVDTTAADTAPTVAAALFRPDKLLGSRALTAADSDSATVALDTARLRTTFATRMRVRVGVRVTAPTPLEVRLGTVESGTPAVLFIRAATDTGVRPIAIAARSTTPATDQYVRASLTDYAVVIRGAPPVDATTLAVGGLPAQRALLRFDVPPSIIDSTTVVYATLALTQRANPGSSRAGDTMVVLPQVVLASPQVSDLYKVAQQVDPTIGYFGTDTLRLVPREAGLKNVDMTLVLRRWHSVPLSGAQRAIVLRGTDEGLSSPQALFWSRLAPDSLVRPHLSIDYIPHIDFGRP